MYNLELLLRVFRIFLILTQPGVKVLFLYDFKRNIQEYIFKPIYKLDSVGQCWKTHKIWNIITCCKMCLIRVLICLVIITLRIMIRGVVRTLTILNCS